MNKSAHVQKGFTLVELLVVIAIIAILAAVVVLIINPLELTKRGRDAARLTDLANLQSAINVAVQEATSAAGTVEILCGVGGSYPCTGSSNVDTRAADGTGWVSVNLSSSKSVSVPTLPVDPTNNLVNHYTYCANDDAWEINAVLESDQQKSKMANDGGPNAADNATDATGRYEVGSSLALIQPSGSGSCTY